MDKLIFKIKVNIYEVKELKVLEEKILAEGRALNENVLKVDSFINHKVDPELMHEIGKEFAEHFKVLHRHL